ncbi:major facilitator superfamily transporter [compost metagenome]
MVSRSRESERGSALSIYTGIADVGAVIGGPSFGWVVDAAGYTALYAGVAAVFAAGLAVVAPWNARAARAAGAGAEPA